MNSKNYKKLIPLFLGVLLVSSQGVFAQSDSYEIGNGGTIRFNAGTYTGTVTSTVTDQTSTAILETGGAVTLQGTYSGYYGKIQPIDSSTLTTDEATFGSRFLIGAAAAAAARTVDIANQNTTLSGTTDTEQVTMDKYGALKINKNLTLTLGKIQLNNYDDANCPKIYFYPAATTPKITISESGMTIKTNDATSNRLNASTHLYFDLANIPVTTLGAQNFTIASFADTDPAVTGTPDANVLNNTNSAWDTFSVDVNAHNLRFNATYNPAFTAQDDSTYKETLAALHTFATEDTTQTLRKSIALTGAQTFTKGLVINIAANSLTGGQTLTINSGKTLGIKGTGTFTNTINFAAVDSVFQIAGLAPAEMFPTISAASTAVGIVNIGDGATETTYTHNAASVTKLNSKVSKFVVKASATLTVTP